MRRRVAGPLVFVAVVLVLAACGGDSTPGDAGPDATGGDGGLDATVDAGRDLGDVDAGPCFVDTDCNDGSDCTVDRCMFSSGTCFHAARDADGDGHGDSACGGDDCDDADANRYPGNHEVCDAHDEDCDPATLGPDVDGDTFVSTACCNPQPTGAPLCGTDCNDLSATINPTAAESCNMVDDNCNGLVDEGVGATCYVDADGDGYAPAGAPMMMSTCTCGSGYTARDPSGAMSADCDDTDATVSPAQTEVCNFRDDNCNCTAGVDPTTCIDEGLARPVSTTTSHFTSCVGAPSCLTLLGTAFRNPIGIGTEVGLTFETTASDWGAAWEPSPLRMGWGPMDVTVRARGVGNTSYPPGVAFAVALVRHVDGSSLAGVAADVGYPIDHNGILIEWVFNGAGADQLVAIKREAPPVTTSPVGFEMARVALPGARFDAGSDTPEHTFTIRYQTYRATGGELLDVYDGATATGVPLIHLTPTSAGVTVGYEFDVYDEIDVGVMSASDATTRSRVYFGADYGGATPPFQSTITRNGVCDTALP